MRWIERCLSYLKASTVQTVPVMIDNGSTDGTRDFIPEHYPEVVWLPQEKNLGFGQGNNVGIRYALEHEADYILLMNQDVYLSDDAIERMLAVSDGHTLLSPVHLNGDGTRLDKMFRYLMNECDTLILDDILTTGKLSPSYVIGRVSAACWFLPVAVIREIGGFNPLFFHYSEDDNYLNRLTFHSVKTMLVPEAKMNHDREEHGNVCVFNRNRLHRDILLVSCNINLSWRGRLVKYLRRLYECYAWDLPRKAYRPFGWLREILWMIAHQTMINDSRRREKEKGLTWL